ncbi:MAG: hypothetical protein WD696_05180 [Bryobacteraceae bacterium]
MQPILGPALCFGLVCVSLAAVRGDEALYVGGTVTAIPEGTKGRLNLPEGDAAGFDSKKEQFSIPYASIESIEYGQKVGRRVGAAVAISPVLLFSKKRKHYVTIGYRDRDGNRQGAVFELSKGAVRRVIFALESRSGKTVDLESEDARKHLGR